MVAATELAPDLRVGKGGQHFRQIHGHLTRPGDVAGAPCREHFGNADVVMSGNPLLDFINGDLTAACPQQVRQQLGGAVDADLAADEAGMRRNAGQRPLKLAHVA